MCVIVQTPGASLVSDALQAIEQLASMGIFNVLFADECRVMLTDHGRLIYRDVREAIDGIVSRVYDVVPTNDLAIADRVLDLAYAADGDVPRTMIIPRTSLGLDAISARLFESRLRPE